MKFIHTADLHLDSRIDTLPSEKGKIRRAEIVRSFERLCEYAAKNDVTAVIIAGDMFDTSRITQKTAGRVFQAIKSCPSIDFLYLSGNHDEQLFIKGDWDFPSNLKFFGKDWTSFDYGNVSISGITLDKYNSSFIYDGLKLDESAVNIVCLHGQVLGYKSEDVAETISIPMLKNKNIDYLALGHIHSYSEGKIDDRGEYAYCGCLDGRGFDETGVKGFILIEENNGKLKREFVPFSSRVFYSKEYSVTESDNFYALRNEIISELESKCSQNDLIKVILTGEHDASFTVDTDDLSNRLNEMFFWGKVYDKTSIKVSAEDYALDKSVRGEFVRAVIASNLSDEEKNEVVKIGLSALKGEL